MKIFQMYLWWLCGVWASLSIITIHTTRFVWAHCAAIFRELLHRGGSVQETTCEMSPQLVSREPRIWTDVWFYCWSFWNILYQTAFNDSFHCGLICGLFSRSLDWLFGLDTFWKNSEKCRHSDPETAESFLTTYFVPAKQILDIFAVFCSSTSLNTYFLARFLFVPLLCSTHKFSRMHNVVSTD